LINQSTLKLTRRFLLAFGIVVAFTDGAHAQQGCGDPLAAGGFGPFDYRAVGVPLKLVESYHFTQDVETLRRGSTGTVGGDLGYTLKVFPNHHRALMSMVNLVFKEKKTQPLGADFPIDCYFQRAEQFKPDDAEVKVIHGIFLIRAKKPKEAVEILERAGAIAGDNANVNYNLALALLDVGRVDDAVRHARIAYSAGFPLPGLKNKLKALGKWDESNVAPVPSK